VQAGPGFGQKKLGREVMGKRYQPYAGLFPTLSCPRRRRRKRLRSLVRRCKKGAVENLIFPFLRKAQEEIKILTNIQLLQVN
jgi:hypothetical protein